MKRLLLFLSLTVVSLQAVDGATITGTVRDARTNETIAGQQIRVINTGWTYADFAISDSDGNYTLNLAASLPIGTGLLVYANACEQSYSNSITYTGSNETIHFRICPSSHQYALQGLFRSGALAGNGEKATIYLISEIIDPVTNNTLIQAIDSFASNGAFSNVDFYRRYSDIPDGKLYLKVALDSGHSQYANYLPTYSGSSLKWNGAKPLTRRSFMSDTAYITMHAGVNPGGPGFLGGYVSEGANKSSAVGDPLQGRILILTKTDGTAVACTWSDATGRFAISNLAYGSYLLSGDVLGKENPELTVTLSAAQPGILDLIFEENDQSFKGRSLALKMAPLQSGELHISPNPARDIIQINGLQKHAGDKTVRIWNALGTQVSGKRFRSGEPGSVDIADLPPGIYTLQVATEAGSTNFKIIK